MEDMMNESEYGPQARRRAAIGIATLLGFVLALLPFAPSANAASTAAVRLTSPNFAEETFTAGQPMTITWATNVTSGNATLELWKDNSGVPAKVADIGTPPAKAGKFTWPVPIATVADDDYSVKITVPGGGIDASAQFFTIQLPTTTVTAPKLGDVWSTGALKTVKWTLKATGLVDLDLVNTSNVVLGTVKHGVSAATGTYAWDIPVGMVTASGTYRVQVKSAGNALVKDSSDDFTLNLATLQVNTPNGGGSYGAGTIVPIKWTTNAPGKVKIELIDTGNSNAATTIATVASKPSTYNWTVPAGLTLGNNRYTVRITSMTGNTVNTMVTDDSDATFSVTAPVFSVTQPDAAVTGGSAWLAGTSHKIIWSAPSLAGNLRIDLADASGNAIKPIKTSVAASANGFTWDIPANFITASGTYKVKLSTLATPVVSVTSAAFDLNLPVLAVTDFSGAQTIGATSTINWTTTIPSGTVKIEYVDSNSVVRLVKSGVSAKALTTTWAVPATLVAGNYTIRITSLGNALVTDDNAVTAFNLPTVTVNTPSAVTAGTGTTSLSWTTALTGTVKLDLTDAAGSVLKSIKTGQPVGTSFSWAVPINFVTATGSYKIKVTSSTNGLITGLSSSTFTITLPTITITAPASNPSWAAGAHTVTWSGLTVGNVKIELFNGSTLVTTLKASVLASSGTSSVTLPALVSSTVYTVKITSLSNTSITQSANFTAP
jgi:hypothetical protein